MTDGDKRLALIVVGLVCVTILVIVLFIALWAYKEILAVTYLPMAKARGFLLSQVGFPASLKVA